LTIWVYTTAKPTQDSLFLLTKTILSAINAKARVIGMSMLVHVLAKHTLVLALLPEFTLVTQFAVVLAPLYSVYSLKILQFLHRLLQNHPSLMILQRICSFSVVVLLESTIMKEVVAVSVTFNIAPQDSPTTPLTANAESSSTDFISIIETINLLNYIFNVFFLLNLMIDVLRKN
jgi:hypothetical protein